MVQSVNATPETPKPVVYRELFINSKDKITGTNTDFQVQLKRTQNLRMDAFRIEAVYMPNHDYQLEESATLLVNSSSVVIPAGSYSFASLQALINDTLSGLGNTVRCQFLSYRLKFIFFNPTSFTIQVTGSSVNQQTLRTMLGISNTSSISSAVVGSSHEIECQNIAVLQPQEHIYVCSRAISRAMKSNAIMTSNFNQDVIGIISQGAFGSSMANIISGNSFLKCNEEIEVGNMIDISLKYDNGDAISTNITDADQVVFKFGYLTVESEP